MTKCTDKLNDRRDKVIGYLIEKLYAKIDHMTRRDDDGNVGHILGFEIPNQVLQSCAMSTALKLGVLMKQMDKFKLSPMPSWPYVGISYEGLVNSIQYFREGCLPHRHGCCTSFTAFMASFRAKLLSEAAALMFEGTLI